MSVIILLLIASLSIATLFLGAFIWSVKNRQFEDGFSPPRRILFSPPAPAEGENSPPPPVDSKPEPITPNTHSSVCS